MWPVNVAIPFLTICSEIPRISAPSKIMLQTPTMTAVKITPVRLGFRQIFRQANRMNITKTDQVIGHRLRANWILVKQTFRPIYLFARLFCFFSFNFEPGTFFHTAAIASTGFSRRTFRDGYSAVNDVISKTIPAPSKSESSESLGYILSGRPY